MKTIKDAPECLNTNDKAMWVLGYNEALKEAEGRLAKAEKDAARYQLARKMGCEVWVERWAGMRRYNACAEELDALLDKRLEKSCPST